MEPMHARLRVAMGEEGAMYTHFDDSILLRCGAIQDGRSHVQGTVDLWQSGIEDRQKERKKSLTNRCPRGVYNPMGGIEDRPRAGE